MTALLSRRALALSLLAAPLIVRTPGLLMPIRPVRRPKLPPGWIDAMTYVAYQDPGSTIWQVVRTG